MEELRQRLALIEEERTHSHEDSDKGSAPGAVSTAVLINLEENGTTALDEGDPHPPLSLPLSSDTVLVPEKLSELPNNSTHDHDHKLDHSHQYLSQELF